MSTSTIDRINQLSAERSRLFLQAANGHRGDSKVLLRIHQLDAELERLWDERRRERAGRRDGIDLLVDRAYQETYGRDFEDAVSPPAVSEADEGQAVAVAA